MILGTIRLPAHNLPAARPVMHRMATASRLEPGCLDYIYAEDLFDPGLIHVKKRWTNQTALDHHFTSSHLKEWRAAWQTLEIGNRDLQLYDVGQSRQT